MFSLEMSPYIHNLNLTIKKTKKNTIFQQNNKQTLTKLRIWTVGVRAAPLMNLHIRHRLVHSTHCYVKEENSSVCGRLSDQ